MKLKAPGERGYQGGDPYSVNRGEDEPETTNDGEWRLGDGGPCEGTDAGGCSFCALRRVREWSGGGSREGGDGLGSFIEAAARGKTLPRREVGAAAVAA